MKIRSDPATVHAPIGAYTHQVEVRDERLLVVAGQIRMAPDGSVSESPVAQLELALENIRLNLEAAAIGEDLPAATLVHVSRLATPHLKAEVEALASAP